MIILLTDILLFLSAMSLFYFREIWWIPGKRPPWFVLVFLGALGLALLDSIHFEGHGTVPHSLLDRILPHAMLQDERSYSYPLSFHDLEPSELGQTQGHLKAVPDFIMSESDNILEISRLLCWGGLGGGVLSLILYRFIRSKKIFFLLVPAGALGFLAQSYHLFGTNQLGTDVLYLSIKSIRTGLIFSILGVGISTPLGIVLGTLAGMSSTWLDELIQYIYSLLSSIPGVLLIGAMMLSLDVALSRTPQDLSVARFMDQRLLLLACILGATNWPSLCRLVRAETMKIRELDFMQNARVMGVSPWRRFFVYLLPQMKSMILMSTVLDMSSFLLAEVVLSYIGVGLDPNVPSFGNMINSARGELSRDPIVWWPFLSSSFVLMLVVFALNRWVDQKQS